MTQKRKGESDDSPSFVITLEGTDVPSQTADKLRINLGVCLFFVYFFHKSAKEGPQSPLSRSLRSIISASFFMFMHAKVSTAFRSIFFRPRWLV